MLEERLDKAKDLGAALLEMEEVIQREDKMLADTNRIVKEAADKKREEIRRVVEDEDERIRGMHHGLMIDVNKYLKLSPPNLRNELAEQMVKAINTTLVKVPRCHQCQEKIIDCECRFHEMKEEEHWHPTSRAVGQGSIWECECGATYDACENATWRFNERERIWEHFHGEAKPVEAASNEPHTALSLRERLSDLQHDIWSHWMRYMFDQGEQDLEGNWIMPRKLVERWRVQMNTPYSDLTDKEKDSDREQADKMLPVIRDFLTDSEAEKVRKGGDQ